MLNSAAGNQPGFHRQVFTETNAGPKCDCSGQLWQERPEKSWGIRKFTRGYEATKQKKLFSKQSK